MTISVFIVIIVGCAFLCLYRLHKGPSAPDRAVALDILGTLLVGFCALYAVKTQRELYLTMGIAWALLSFAVTIALAKYLEGKAFDE